MNINSYVAMAAIVAGLMAAPATAAVLDDFNRADASTLGSGWTVNSGTVSIVDNMATGSNFALATYNGGASDTISFDIAVPGTAASYAAAVFGFESGNNYFIKVQSNGGGAFDRYAFYNGNNSSAGGGIFATLSSSFSSASITASYSGTIATLVITPNIGAQQIYTRDYGYAPGSSSIGLGFYGAARVDNFGTGAVSAVPEPATWAMMIGGFGMVGAGMRRRSTASATALQVAG